MKMIELITTNLQQDNQPFRENLVTNFQTIQDELNNLESDLDGYGKKLDNFISTKGSGDQTAMELKNQLTGMASRINRIVLGTDDTAIRLVVNEILRDEGVIK